MSKKTEPDSVTMTFDLHDLPTAQHRAGLAGLILQIDSMGEKGNKRSPKLIPVIDEESFTATSATITFTRDSMQGVFDDLYAAKFVEVVVAAKWPGETKPKPGEFFVKRKDQKTGELKQAPGFAYDVVQPQAPCLSRHLDEGTKSPWLDLWRQMVWSIPRGGNNVRSRAPFIDRANDRPCGDGATAWTQAVDLEKKKTTSQLPTAPISGALMLGAQAVNAEGVAFSGRVDHNLLLHFWQLVVLTFVPQVVSKKDAKVERVGYVLAIPDVADLERFPRRSSLIFSRTSPCPTRAGRSPRPGSTSPTRGAWKCSEGSRIARTRQSRATRSSPSRSPLAVCKVATATTRRADRRGTLGNLPRRGHPGGGAAASARSSRITCSSSATTSNCCRSPGSPAGPGSSRTTSELPGPIATLSSGPR